MPNFFLMPNQYPGYATVAVIDNVDAAADILHSFYQIRPGFYGTWLSVELARDVLQAAGFETNDEFSNYCAERIVGKWHPGQFYFHVRDPDLEYGTTVVICPIQFFEANGHLEDDDFDEVVMPLHFHYLTDATYETALTPSEARSLLRAAGFVENSRFSTFVHSETAATLVPRPLQFAPLARALMEASKEEPVQDTPTTTVWDRLDLDL